MEVLEDRKMKEVEHSRKRREVLQGFERLADTHAAEQVEDLGSLIKDKKKFNYYFSNMKYYSVTTSSEEYKHEWLRNNCTKDTKILDFACGNGENGIYAAGHGAQSVGIDISPEGIVNAKNNAEKMEVSERCQFHVMDGENMTFDDNTFDLAVEYGALHHVELDTALCELSRVLKSNGKMICVEALRHNPLIHLYRKRTPHLRTEWEVEHILGVESLTIFEKYFEKVEVKYFHFFSLLLVPFRKTFIFKKLHKLMDRLDELFLKNKFFGKYAWIMVVTLEKPKNV